MLMNCDGHRRAATRSDESEDSNRRTVLDVHHTDFAVGLGEVEFLALNNSIGVGSANGASGGTVGGVDDSDKVAFEFCCVGHAPILPATRAVTNNLQKYCVITLGALLHSEFKIPPLSATMTQAGGHPL